MLFMPRSKVRFFFFCGKNKKIHYSEAVPKERSKMSIHKTRHRNNVENSASETTQFRYNVDKTAQNARFERENASRKSIQPQKVRFYRQRNCVETVSTSFGCYLYNRLGRKEKNRRHALLRTVCFERYYFLCILLMVLNSAS